MKKPTLSLLVFGLAALFLAGYSALSHYASHLAAQTLDDLRHEHRLAPFISWASVSSSPLGGTITLTDVHLQSPPPAHFEFSAQRVTLKNLRYTDPQHSGQIELYHVQPTYPESPFGQQYRQALLDSFLASNEQQAATPQNFSASWDYHSDQHRLSAALTLEAPTAFYVQAQLAFEQVRHPGSLVLLSQASPHTLQPAQAIPNAPLDAFRQRLIAEALSPQLSHAELAFQPRGTASNSTASSRSAQPNSSPSSSRYRQPDAHHRLAQCRALLTPLYAAAEPACQQLFGTGLANNTGFRATLSPVNVTTLADVLLLFSGDVQQARHALDQLNLNITPFER